MDVGLVEEVHRYLAGEQGRWRLRRALESRRLPLHLADDLAQEVLRRTLVALHRGTAIDNPAAFANTLADRAAIDWLRRRPPVPDVSLDDEAVGEATAVDPVVIVEGRGVIQAIRRCIGTLLGGDPTTGAAALAFVAVTAGGAPVADDCPRPAGGATATEAAEWAGLWYAGRRDCFPARAGDDSPAVRKRRSRAAARLRDRLREAARAAGLAGPAQEDSHDGR